jgi:hypothetical protein
VNLSELRGRVRQKTNDGVAPYLNGDDYLNSLLNEAADEACIRAKLIFEEGTPLCQFDLVNGQGVYAVDPSIIEIKDVWLFATNPMFPNNGRQLLGVDQTLLDDQRQSPLRLSYTAYPYSYGAVPTFAYTNWRNWKGDPLYFLQDTTGAAVRMQLVPIPVISSPTYAQQARMSVYRTPNDAEHMDTDQDEPAINRRWHKNLIDWALYQIYDDFDGEMADPVKAAAALDRFEKAFGKRDDANVERKRAERSRRTIRIAW